MQMAKTIFIISTSNFATLQKPVFSKRCFAQKHPQPLLIFGENLMQNASFQKTLKTTYHSSSVDDTCPKQIYSMRAVHFQVNSWMNSLPSRRIQYDGLAQTGVLSYPLLPRHRQHCIDHANRYKLVRKDDHKGELSRPSHQKYVCCTVEFNQIASLKPNPVPVAVNSKNLVIDSATCSDCNKLHHLELHCISKKITPAKPEIQNFRLT